MDMVMGRGDGPRGGRWWTVCHARALGMAGRSPRAVTFRLQLRRPRPPAPARLGPLPSAPWRPISVGGPSCRAGRPLRRDAARHYRDCQLRTYVSPRDRRARRSGADSGTCGCGAESRSHWEGPRRLLRGPQGSRAAARGARGRDGLGLAVATAARPRGPAGSSAVCVSNLPAIGHSVFKTYWPQRFQGFHPPATERAADTPTPPAGFKP